MSIAQHAFLSYVRADTPLIDRFAADLTLRGVDVWLDRERINPGQRWRDAIRDAIASGSLFIACFSAVQAARERSYMNEELTLAIDELRQRAADRSWFIPVLLPGGAVPIRRLGAGETLRDLQWVDLSVNWGDGVDAIARLAFEKRLQQARFGTPAQLTETLVERVARMAVARVAEQERASFLSSRIGVVSACAEFDNLVAEIKSCVANFEPYASDLGIVVDVDGSCCAVRTYGFAVVLHWRYRLGDRLDDDAFLSLKEFEGALSLGAGARIIGDLRQVSEHKFRFDRRMGLNGWSSPEGGFEVSSDFAALPIDLLTARVGRRS